MGIQSSIIALFFCCLFIQSCKNEQTKEATNTHTEHEHVAHNESHDHPILKEMSLNNGEKWQLQPELMRNVENMEQAIANANNETETDYQALADTLKSETNQMISNCTMKGESHNELHKWLEPHMAMLKDLKAADNNDAKNILNEIDASFDLLREYFK